MATVPTRIETIEGLTIGGTWRLRVPFAALDSRGPDPRGIVQAGFDLVENQMSAWRATSALSQINAAPDTFSILMGGAQRNYGLFPARSARLGMFPSCWK